MTAETKRGKKDPAEAAEDGQDGFPNVSQLHSIISDFLVGFLLQVSAVSLVERRIDGSDFLLLFLPKGDEGSPGKGKKRKKLLRTRQISQ